VITQRNIDVGSLITADATAGTSMFAMTHSDLIGVWVYVPQDDAFRVKPGIAAVAVAVHCEEEAGPCEPEATLHTTDVEPRCNQSSKNPDERRLARTMI
jgi:hypothetical protein